MSVKLPIAGAVTIVPTKWMRRPPKYYVTYICLLVNLHLCISPIPESYVAQQFTALAVGSVVDARAALARIAAERVRAISSPGNYTREASK